MVTDDERREVAKRLRGMAGRRCFTGTEIERCMGAKDDARGYDDDAQGYMRLADLIEPGPQCPYYSDERHWCSIHDIETERTCIYVYDEESAGWRCSECGGLEPVGDHVRYCPDCGARVDEP